MSADTSARLTQKKGLRSMLAGAGGGLITTVVCSPLDVAKVRLQVQGSFGVTKYNGIFHTMGTIFKEEGIPGFFRGLESALVTAPLFWGIYFSCYESCKEYLTQREMFSSAAQTHVASAVTAGFIGGVITNPLYLTRTRIQTQIFHTHDRVLPKNFSTFRMMKEIYKNEGMFAFYRGIDASFLGLSHVAIQFPLYEYLKRFLRERRNATDDAVTDIIVASIAAKFVATTVSYPHEVLRSRLQDLTVAPLAPSPWPSSGSRSKSLDKHRTTGSQSKDMAAEIPEQKQQLRRGLSLWTVAKTLVRDEGVLALWTGLRVNLIRVVPATITTFLSYEYLSKLLNSMKYLKD